MPAPDVFELFTKHKDEQAIVDWMISEATLEEVFLFLAEQAHAKTTEGVPHRKGRRESTALNFLRRGSIALGRVKVTPDMPDAPLPEQIESAALSGAQAPHK